MTKPSSSQYSSLTRSLRLLRKTKTWPDSGSACKCWRTCSARPSKLRRRSTGWLASQMRTAGGKLSMRASPPRWPVAGAASPGRSRLRCGGRVHWSGRLPGPAPEPLARRPRPGRAGRSLEPLAVAACVARRRSWAVRGGGVRRRHGRKGHYAATGRTSHATVVLCADRAVCRGPWGCPPFGGHCTTDVKNGVRRTDTEDAQLVAGLRPQLGQHRRVEARAVADDHARREAGALQVAQEAPQVRLVVAADQGEG